MANDAFSNQIVQMVRNMPADAILALVKNQLDHIGGLVRTASPMIKVGARRGRPPRSVELTPVTTLSTKRRGRPVGSGKKISVAKGGVASAIRRGPGRPPKSAEGGRVELFDKVEKIVRSSSGIATSAVAKASGLAQPRAAAVLKELKNDKRIFQGGDRRFARYAGDQKTADQASLSARNGAIGPNKKSVRGRKSSK